MSKFKIGDVVKPVPLSDMYINYNLNPNSRGVVIKDSGGVNFDVLVDWGRDIGRLWAFDSETELAIVVVLYFR